MPKNKVKEMLIKPNHETFVKEFLSTGNGYQSAIKAGYKKSTAVNVKNRILKRDRIQFLIREKIKNYNLLEKTDCLKLVEGTFSEITANGKSEMVRVIAGEKLAKLRGLMSEDDNVKIKVGAVVLGLLKEAGVKIAEVENREVLEVATPSETEGLLKNPEVERVGLPEVGSPTEFEGEKLPE